MGNRTRVKICGITSVDDAILAAEAGADAIGLIFHPPASRGISPTIAEQITAALPPFVDPVALFLDSPAFGINAITRRLKITWVQLHGHETPANVAELADHQVIKAIHVRPGKLDETLAPWREAVAKGLPNLRALVLETGWSNVQGGSGIENDWDQILQVQLEGGFDGLPPIILAGGLRASTVGSVIERLHPWAVDVSSGVEEIKGHKSADRVAAFIRAVRHADHNNNGVTAGA
jgi:phosphoribosylanthranilate isomerase